MNKIKCINCGKSIPDVPEDSTFEELLCDQCYEEQLELEDEEAQIAWDLDNIFNRS